MRGASAAFRGDLLQGKAPQGGTFSIYIIIAGKITPSYGKALLNTGLKKLNTLNHPCIARKPIPATSPDDIHLPPTPDKKRSNDATARSGISRKRGAGWGDGPRRPLFPQHPRRNRGRADVLRAACPLLGLTPAGRCPAAPAQDPSGFWKPLPVSAQHTLSAAPSHQKVITLRARYDSGCAITAWK